MSEFIIKLIAAAAMLIDHAGMALFPAKMLLRIVGRLAFPIFAWSVAQGCRKTGNYHRYLLRLALCAAVSEPCFDLASAGTLWQPDHQSTLLTLLLAALAVAGLRSLGGGWAGLFPVVLCCAAAELLRADYGWYGVATVVLFYWAAGLPAAAAGYALLSLVLQWNMLYGWAAAGLWLQLLTFPHQLWGLLAFVPLLLFNGQRGPRSGRFFYIFYPAHLLALGLIRHFAVI